MSNEYTCPYCFGAIPSKDFAAKDADGGYWHMPCQDMALAEWRRLKAENEILREAVLKNSNVIVNVPALPESFVIKTLQEEIEFLQKQLALSEQNWRGNDGI